MFELFLNTIVPIICLFFLIPILYVLYHKAWLSALLLLGVLLAWAAVAFSVIVFTIFFGIPTSGLSSIDDNLVIFMTVGVFAFIVYLCVFVRTFKRIRLNQKTIGLDSIEMGKNKE